MSHVLTVKIPYSLLTLLEKEASKEGKSKGAMVRNALEAFLGKSSQKTDSVEQDYLQQIKEATQAFIKGKSPKKKGKVDWTELYRKAALNPDSSAEEEVMKFRRRGL